MPRRVKCRKVCHYPQTLEFLPQNNNAQELEPIILTVDEYEAIRLIDRRGMSQEQCAVFMQIARTTVQRIYETARKKRQILLWKDGRCVLKAEISSSVTAAVQAATVLIALSKNYMKNTRKREKIL